MKRIDGFTVNQNLVCNYSIQKTTLVIILIIMITFVGCDEILAVKRNEPSEVNAEQAEKPVDDPNVNYDEYPVGDFLYKKKLYNFWMQIKSLDTGLA